MISRLSLVTLLLVLSHLGQECAAAPATTPWETPPGWTQTTGGADGRTIRVTTLAASGTGSLAEALAVGEPRTIEFAVAGTIDLGGRSLRITQPFVTIAGETAPSPGITFINGGMNVTTHDVIIRHIRIRPGAGSRARKSGWEVDGLATGGGAHDVIVDHCTLTWATDENLSASGPRFNGATLAEWRQNTSHRVTFSHNLIGEGLNESTHSKGSHSKGSLIHDNATEIAIIGNLYISNDDRNPFFKGGAQGVIVNNLIHNPGTRVMQYALNSGEWTGHAWERGRMVVVGNVAKKGPSSAAEVAFLEALGPLDVHLRDNLYFDASGTALPVEVQRRGKDRRLFTYEAGNDLQIAAQAMFWPPRLNAKAASETQDWVLSHVGARAWDRDDTDRRLVEQARIGQGKIIDFESEAGSK